MRGNLAIMETGEEGEMNMSPTQVCSDPVVVNCLSSRCNSGSAASPESEGASR